METLAYLHLASAYEESSTVEAVILLPKLNLFGLLKQQKFLCKAWIYGLSLSLTLVLLRIFSSALASQMGEYGYQVSNLVSNPISKIEFKQNIKTSSPISNRSSKVEPNGNISNISSISSPSSKTKFKQNKNSTSVSDGRSGSVHALNHTPLGDIKVDGSLVSQIQTDKNRHLAVLVNDVRKANSHPTISQRATLPAQAPLQHGKLILRNDTEIGSLIFLHAPGADSFTRYAYVPPCTTREMSAEYSTEWRASSDTLHLHNIDVGEGGVLEVTRSTLSSHSSATDCDPTLRAKALQIATTLNSPITGHNTIPPATIQEIRFGLGNNLVGKASDFIKSMKDDVDVRLAKVEGDPAQSAVVVEETARRVDDYTTRMVADTLRKLGRNMNVQDTEELLLVAAILKGNGDDLGDSATNLERYIKDCYIVFSSKYNAQDFLAAIQKLQWYQQNLQQRVAQYREDFVEITRQDPNARTRKRIVTAINNQIVPDDPINPRYSNGILCLDDESGTRSTRPDI